MSARNKKGFEENIFKISENPKFGDRLWTKVWKIVKRLEKSEFFFQEKYYVIDFLCEGENP